MKNEKNFFRTNEVFQDTPSQKILSKNSKRVNKCKSLRLKNLNHFEVIHGAIRNHIVKKQKNKVD